jgi:EmrB/QacA subfamily drug resistance transporter
VSAAPEAPPSPAYKWVALSNTTIGTLMAALDSNIVIIALPTIARELPGTSVLSLIWILMGYSLVTAVVLLSFGRLSDQFGRARLYTLGFGVFTIGSLLCGLSQTSVELIGFRMVQALGAGFIFSNSAAILTDAFPANERGRVSGLVVGGILTSVAGWRWIFFVNVPIGIVATIWSHYRLRELAYLDTVRRVDWAGNIAFAGGLTAILVAVSFTALGLLDSAAFAGLLVLGLGLLALFVYVESHVAHPMFDLSLFRLRAFSFSALAMFVNALARGAFSFVLVFYLQSPPHSLSPLTAGLFLVPVSASLAAFGPISGALSDRYGPRGLASLGLIVSAAGFVILTQVTPDASFLSLVPAFVLVGAGMGLFASPNRAAMMNAVPPRRRGIAAGTGTTLINSGTTLSLGLAILIMSQSLPFSSLDAIFLGASTGASGGGVPVTEFLSSVHLVFAISAGLLLACVVPSMLRSGPAPSDRGGAVV